MTAYPHDHEGYYPANAHDEIDPSAVYFVPFEPPSGFDSGYSLDGVAPDGSLSPPVGCLPHSHSGRLDG